MRLSGDSEPESITLGLFHATRRDMDRTAVLTRDASGGLKIETLPNAETPVMRNDRTVLTCDLWEHAYYIDYRNERERYLKELVDQRLNWQFAEENWSRIK